MGGVLQLSDDAVMKISLTPSPSGRGLFFKTKWARRLADLIPASVAVHTIDGARMHFPDERAEQFIPLLRQHWTMTIATQSLDPSPGVASSSVGRRPGTNGTNRPVTAPSSHGTPPSLATRGAAPRDGLGLRDPPGRQRLDSWPGASRLIAPLTFDLVYPHCADARTV